MDKIEVMAPYILKGMGILVAVLWIGYFIVVEYRSWKKNNAPVETARAVAHCKDPNPQASIYGRNHTYIYYITFQTESGDLLKLYMDRDPYFSIPEGASGELPWQETKFWKFILEDGTEVK